MADDEAPQPGKKKQSSAVTRRQFLRHAGVAGAASVLLPNLLQHGDTALSAQDTLLAQPPNDEPSEDTEGNDNMASVHAGAIRLVLSVNGQDRAVTVEPRTTLLNALRNHLDPAITGPKLVCDRGACGACTVEMDGKTALKKNPHPTLAQVRAACAGNICRCGTYPKVFEAALAVAERVNGKGA
jgi:xanthine dehydrogenase YagT iron-sulfur-binding subunit